MVKIVKKERERERERERDWVCWLEVGQAKMCIVGNGLECKRGAPVYLHTAVTLGKTPIESLNGSTQL